MSRTREQPRLVGGLITRKGAALPAVGAAEPPPMRPQNAALLPSPATVPVPSPGAARPAGTVGTIAVTVRLDPERYERLKIFGVRNRRSNQDLLVEALDTFLEVHDR
jgi:hypothetical protein